MMPVEIRRVSALASLTRATTLPLALLGLTATTASAIPTNLAPAGSATASSEGFGTVAPDGIDNNREGDYNLGSVFHSENSPTPAFYQVDLGTSAYLDRVQILPRTDARQGSVEDFRLTVFADAGGTPGAQVFTGTYLPAPERPADFAWGTTDLRTGTPGGTFGRFVRLERLDTTPDFLTFAEFEVFGQSTPLPANLAAGKPATASPAGFGSAIADGVDGDIAGDFFKGGFPVYHSEAQGVGQFYQVDLGQQVDLDYLRLFDRGDAETTSQFRVSVLDAGSTEVFSAVVNSAGLTQYDHTLDLTSVAGRYVRVETTLNEFLAFSEIEAFAVIPEPAALSLAAIALPALLKRRRAIR